MKVEMESYTAEVFQPYVGQLMTFEPASGKVASQRVQLELVQIRHPRVSVRPDGLREPFALLFVSRGVGLPGSGLHRLLHDDFEPTEWLLTRVFMPGQDSATPHYEAVFG
jgi:hypothetical protein